MYRITSEQDLFPHVGMRQHTSCTYDSRSRCEVGGFHGIDPTPAAGYPVTCPCRKPVSITHTIIPTDEQSNGGLDFPQVMSRIRYVTCLRARFARRNFSPLVKSQCAIAQRKSVSDTPEPALHRGDTCPRLPNRIRLSVRLDPRHEGPIGPAPLRHLTFCQSASCAPSAKELTGDRQCRDARAQSAVHRST